MLEIPRKGTRELSIRQHAMHRHAVAGIDILVYLPRSTKEVWNGGCGTAVPADGQLSAVPVEPDHDFLRGSGRGVPAVGGEDEVEADIACYIAD